MNAFMRIKDFKSKGILQLLDDNDELIYKIIDKMDDQIQIMTKFLNVIKMDISHFFRDTFPTI